MLLVGARYYGVMTPPTATDIKVRFLWNIGPANYPLPREQHLTYAGYAYSSKGWKIQKT
ncbi:hypothetical protein [Turicimonas muris]|uniref:hypothetical protein n=1 Tax=Turicimonas muris TaxID=1796652 RepID=UPI003F675B68